MQPTIIYSLMPSGYEETTLIVFGFLFLIFELFFVSYGLLAFFGLTALGLGFYHIYSAPEALGYFKQSIVIGTSIGFVISFSFFFWWLRKDQKKNHRRDFFEFAGKSGVVSSVIEGKNPPFRYQIKFQGEYWSAECKSPLSIHDEIEIIKQKEESLIFEIKPRG
ncbi:MAG: NfeD family protein [Bacteriovoracaceae bacterium]